MTALHVVVRPRPESSTSLKPLAALSGVLDIVVDGVNLTARVGEGHALDFLLDLTFAVSACIGSERQRASVPLHAGSEVWELGLVSDGDSLLLSVFCPGPVTSVAVHDRRVSIIDFRRALLQAIEQAKTTAAELPAQLRIGLDGARDGLLALGAHPKADELTSQTIELSSAVEGLSLDAKLLLRRAKRRATSNAQLERADMLALLSDGRLSVGVTGGALSSGPSQVFLDAERLLGLAECTLTSWQSARPTYRRILLSSSRMTLRRGPGESRLDVSFCSTATASAAARTHRMSPVGFVRLASQFALQLTSQLHEHDPEQLRNLRLRDLQQRAEQLMRQVLDSGDDESSPNLSPDSYRRFLPKLRRTVGMWETGPKMRFMPRWVASVPQIDLRATFLCGDHLMVGGAAETACIKRGSGDVVWKRSTKPAACVVTPAGLVRIEADGKLQCHQLEDGEVRFGMNVVPRPSGIAAGSVLHGPGLPKILALVEGDSHVSGIDLLCGSLRWRHAAKRPGNYRLRRAGRLLLVSGGDPLMVALDAIDGEVVWSLRARLPFTGDVAVDHDSAFTLSGSNGGRFRLHRFNPCSGQSDWEVELDERPVSGRPPLLTKDAVVVPTLDQEGSGALAFDRRTGELLWEQAPGLIGPTAAWLCVDDCVIANGASGVLLGLSAADGHVRFNHVFSSSNDADQPRRLEPVLRSGALFVPQQQVHVVRPRDGELLGTLPSDLIPDLIRVDERCDVYVAEESGHLAAFGAAPRLALVR